MASRLILNIITCNSNSINEHLPVQNVYKTVTVHHDNVTNRIVS